MVLGITELSQLKLMRQAGTASRRRALDDIDFDVYKADLATD